MTVRAALAAADAALRAGDSARFDARRLLAALLDRNPAWLLAHDDEALDDAVAQRFRIAVERRAAGEPVAYILGEAGFYGRAFAVSPEVLVPRPESELLVTLALEALRSYALVPLRLCDVGTGSGNLAVTLAAELPQTTLTAIDISPAALACARRNARAHGVEARIAFVLGDALEAVEPHERFACVIANLPYVRTGDLQPLPAATAFEPRLALDGGPDGLDRYRAFLARALQSLEPGGTLLMEAGPDTAAALAALARQAAGDGARVRVERDYAGLERVVRVTAPGEPPGRSAKPYEP